DAQGAPGGRGRRGRDHLHARTGQAGDVRAAALRDQGRRGRGRAGGDPQGSVRQDGACGGRGRRRGGGGHQKGARVVLHDPVRQLPGGRGPPVRGRGGGRVPPRLGWRV